MADELSFTSRAIDIFHEITMSGKRLTGVKGQYYPLELDENPRMLVSIELVFDNESVIINAIGDDDSLSISSNQSLQKIEEHVIEPIDMHLPWKNALNLPLMWAWVMVNQQRYFDGLKLEFCEASDKKATSIELIVMACALRIK